MKVLFVTPLQDNPHTYKALSLLAKDEEVEVVLTSCEPRTLYPGIVELPIHYLPSPEAHIDSGVRGLRRLAMEYREYRFVAHLRGLQQAHDFDVVHAEWLTKSAYCAVRAGCGPVVGVAFATDVINDPCNANPYTHPRLLKRLRETVPQLAAIHVNSQSSAASLTELTETTTPIHVFPHFGIDTTRFAPVDPAEKAALRTAVAVSAPGPLMIWTRHFDDVYAPQDLIAAMSDVARRYPTVTLLMVGDGPQRARCAAQVASLGLGGSITIHEPVPNARLHSYYQMADLYVTTSLSDGTSHSLMEAMACGLPVVATDVPGNLEWIRTDANGIVCRRGSAEDIAAGIIRALDLGLHQSGSAENRAIAEEHFEMTANYRRLKDIYSEAIATSPKVGS